jgi:hypothetical protein
MLQLLVEKSRDYLRRNPEFTEPGIDEIADILFRSECA